MKKSKIILIVIFVIASLAVLYFAYGVVKGRYLGGKAVKVENANTTSSNQSVDQAANPENSVDGSTAPQDSVPVVDSSGKPVVEKADCNNNCAKFKDNADNLKYCQEICGDAPVTKKNSEADCANLNGLEKDYCWRDLAVSKLDIDICEKISDAKLKTVCRNRVTEEILN